MRTAVLEATPGWAECCLEVTRELCWSVGGDLPMVLVRQGTACGYRERVGNLLVVWSVGSPILAPKGRVATKWQPWAGLGITKKNRSARGSGVLAPERP